jgi:hypothetical protein
VARCATPHSREQRLAIHTARLRLTMRRYAITLAQMFNNSRYTASFLVYWNRLTKSSFTVHTPLKSDKNNRFKPELNRMQGKPLHSIHCPGRKYPAPSA